MRIVKYINLILAIGLVFLFSSFLPLLAKEPVCIVVAKGGGQGVSADDIKAFFNGVKLTWPDGKKIQIVDQAETEVGKNFYDRFMGKSYSKIKLKWTKLLLSGAATAPKKCGSDQEVITALLAAPNAIGYIAASSLNDKVEEIFRIE